MSPIDRARSVRDRLPAGGLFAGMDWRIAPGPIPLGAPLVKELEGLGRVLLQFNRAVNLLYRQSVAGKQPPWVAQWLDHGKPAELVALQRAVPFKHDVPRVIRPDLLVTQQGLCLTELDSVPGGIGLTAWLGQTYAQLPDSPAPVGGAAGTIEAFASIFADAPRVHVVVSEEAATYRPEMEWLAAQLDPGRFQVRDGRFADFAAGDAVYRFFELFDLANVPNSGPIFAAAARGELRVTPPPKAIFEEKLLFALLWNRNLREFWRRELGEGFFERLLKLVPPTWLVNPEPLPPQAAIPGLEITQWGQLKLLSQRERDLVLKVSGFSDQAWGARSVSVGSDLPAADWSAALDEALARWDTSPYVLQRYRKPAVVSAAWADFARGELVTMPGRMRLCPYYFVTGDREAARTRLGGVLATVCPADKKIIHGMPEAILAPACV